MIPASLIPSLVAFGRLLRSLGLPVKTEQMTTLAAALAQIDMARRVDFKATCCAVLINRHEHLPLFHLAFDAFWQDAPPNGRQPINLGEILRKVRRQVGYYAAVAEGAAEGEETLQDRSFAYSYAATLRFKDFAELDREELSQVRQEMSKIAWELPPRRTRRKQPFHGREHVDLRRTLHHNLRHGGELVRLVHRSRKLSPRPIVALCDISGSMERYSRILLQFLYIVANRKIQQRARNLSAARVESFVFSTRLTRITHHLARRDIDDALRQATHSVHDWGSGTRIGESIREFNYRWARRVLNRGAVVLIISDGWDRGDIDLLRHEMARLRRSCSRIVWLNPLLGNADYQPLVRGIHAALPFVDDFLPVHNLASLEQLSRTLKEHVRISTASVWRDGNLKTRS
jgi:uncharacterized protein